MDGINVFGSLTLQNGKKLEFKDFDLDGNGEVSDAEFKLVLNDNKIDTVELSNVDTNNDKTITEDEYEAYEQKAQIKEAIDKKVAADKDFTGIDASLAAIAKQELSEYAMTFISTYSGDVKDMAETFKKELESIYTAVKNTVMQNSSTAIKGNVLDNVYNSILNDLKADSSLTGESAKFITNAVVKKLETLANTFVKSYKGSNLYTDLYKYLQTAMVETDAGKMQKNISSYRAVYSSLGGYKDENDLTKLKAAATELLQAAVEKGVTVKLGGKNIATTAAITSAIKAYTDAEKLNDDIEKAISELSLKNLQESIIEAKREEARAEANKSFVSIKGEQYQINPALIDLSKIPNYGKQIHQRGRGWKGSKDKAFNEGAQMLQGGALKSQVKAQIEAMLKEKGVSFENVAIIVENVYSQTVADTLNSEGMITGRGARGLSSKGHAYIDTTALVSAFLENFNTNITAAINEMNASKQDIDLQDIDYSVLNKTDANGYKIGNDYIGLYFSGKEIREVGPTRIKNQANELLENLKPQMFTKAKMLCEATGVKFDNTIFETMANNAQFAAVNAATSSNWIIATLNTKTLIDTFNQSFKENFTSWVETEKNKTNSK